MGDPPIESELMVLAHVPAGVFDMCASTEQRWGGEVDAVYCYNADGRFDATYATFLAKDVLEAAYVLDVAAADPKPGASRTCAKPPYEGSWSEAPSRGRQGRALCTQYDDYGTIHGVIQWTDQSNLVMGYLTTTKVPWAELVATWQAEVRLTR